MLWLPTELLSNRPTKSQGSTLPLISDQLACLAAGRGGVRIRIRNNKQKYGTLLLLLHFEATKISFLIPFFE